MTYDYITTEWREFAHVTIDSQRLNSGKPLADCCEWLWSIAMWANETLPLRLVLRLTLYLNYIFIHISIIDGKKYIRKLRKINK